MVKKKSRNNEELQANQNLAVQKQFFRLTFCWQKYSRTRSRMYSRFFRIIEHFHRSSLKLYNLPTAWKLLPSLHWWGTGHRQVDGEPRITALVLGGRGISEPRSDFQPISSLLYHSHSIWLSNCYIFIGCDFLPRLNTSICLLAMPRCSAIHFTYASWFYKYLSSIDAKFTSVWH